MKKKKITNKHHLCYQKKLWKRNGPRKLRNYWYCQVYVPKDLHVYIHDHMPTIDPPDDVDAFMAVTQLEMLTKHGIIRPEDPIEIRLCVLIGILKPYDRRASNEFKRQLDIINAFNKKAP